MARARSPEEFWRSHLTHHPSAKLGRLVFQRLPSAPRCKLCHTPFGPPAGPVMRMLGRPRSQNNPEVCDPCERYLAENIGGAELEISMLFADVRGSTGLAERMSASAFSELMGKFYSASSRVLIDSNAMVHQAAGDQVMGYFFPAFAGKKHAAVAIQAGVDLLRATGHADPDGPWIPVGAGVHTGIAFCGAVERANGMAEYVVLGDSVNTAARLSSVAAAGELLFSNASAVAAGYDTSTLESRDLTLRGRTETVKVWVERISAPSESTA